MLFILILLLGLHNTGYYVSIGLYTGRYYLIFFFFIPTVVSFGKLSQSVILLIVHVNTSFKAFNHYLADVINRNVFTIISTKQTWVALFVYLRMFYLVFFLENNMSVLSRTFCTIWTLYYV